MKFSKPNSRQIYYFIVTGTAQSVRNTVSPGPSLQHERMSKVVDKMFYAAVTFNYKLYFTQFCEIFFFFFKNFNTPGVTELEPSDYLTIDNISVEFADLRAVSGKLTAFGRVHIL